MRGPTRLIAVLLAWPIGALLLVLAIAVFLFGLALAPFGLVLWAVSLWMLIGGLAMFALPFRD